MSLQHVASFVEATSAESSVFAGLRVLPPVKQVAGRDQSPLLAHVARR